LADAKYAAALRLRGHCYARPLRSVGDRLLNVACAMLRNGTQSNPLIGKPKKCLLKGRKPLAPAVGFGDVGGRTDGRQVWPFGVSERPRLLVLTVVFVIF
jgi:hypothetical protein